MVRIARLILILGSGPAMSNFRQIDRETGFLLPPSVDEWLPERHLARFIVEVVAGLDLRAMSGRYRGSGSASYHPKVLLGLLVYGYATGVFSSRKLERATYDSVAFRFIAATIIPITIRSRRFGGDFCRRSRTCLCRCWFWHGRSGF
jgi:transposase